jgi:hypothetical protein
MYVVCSWQPYRDLKFWRWFYEMCLPCVIIVGLLVGVGPRVFYPLEWWVEIKLQKIGQEDVPYLKGLILANTKNHTKTVWCLQPSTKRTRMIHQSISSGETCFELACCHRSSKVCETSWYIKPEDLKDKSYNSEKEWFICTFLERFRFGKYLCYDLTFFCLFVYKRTPMLVSISMKFHSLRCIF